MSSGGQNDNQLYTRLKYGDEQAFRLIYERYHKPLYRFALKYLRSKELAKDAVHDIFIKIWNKRKNLDCSGTLKGYLFTVTKNHVLNEKMLSQNKQRLKKHIMRQYERDNSHFEDDNVIILSEYRELYKEAVGYLPAKRQEVFKLRTKEGLTIREVANYMGISEHTVKSQHYKAFNFVRDYVHKNIKKTGTGK